MESPNPGHPGRRSLLPALLKSPLTSAALALALMFAGLAGGWWIGQRQASGSGASGAIRTDPKQAALQQELSQLQRRLERNEVSDADRQRLLELLVALGRRAEAMELLEPMADREPDRWSLRLMLAELRRDQGDRLGAERELRQILSRQPTQPEALQLMTLLKLEQNRGAEAEAQVKAAYAASSKPEPKPEALDLGLLLADLQQKRMQTAQAEATYQQLATRFPEDQRPLIGLALMRQERGNLKGAQEALAQARLRSKDPEKPDPRLDRLAAGWGMKALRAPSAKPQESPPQEATGSQNP